MSDEAANDVPFGVLCSMLAPTTIRTGPPRGPQATCTAGSRRAHHQRDLLGFFDGIDLGGKSNRRSVTRNKNLSPVMMRLRLQMLVPVSVRCSWNRRISSAVAVPGERFKYAANRLQLLVWLLCVCGLSLRALCPA